MSVHQNWSDGNSVYERRNSMAYVGYPQEARFLESNRQTQEDWTKFDAERAKQAPKRKQKGEPGAWTPEDEEQDRRMNRMTPASVRRAGGISKKELDARRKARGKQLYRGKFPGDGGRMV
jgi:hypothetical protein